MDIELDVNGLKVACHYEQEDIEQIFMPLIERWINLRQAKQGRIFVFLAAPPACGKSTLALFLECLSKGSIQALGMDGFHYPNAYLDTHTMKEGEREVPLRLRKGAPQTFDKDLLCRKIEAGKMYDNLWPSYSRKIHDPIEDQIKLTKSIILLEGNYLLLDTLGWQHVKDEADDTVFIDTDPTVLRERLIERKVKGGCSLADAIAFYEESDAKNVELVLKHHHQANIHLYLREGRYFWLS